MPRGRDGARTRDRAGSLLALAGFERPEWRHVCAVIINGAVARRPSTRVVQQKEVPHHLIEPVWFLDEGHVCARFEKLKARAVDPMMHLPHVLRCTFVEPAGQEQGWQGDFG